MDQLLLGNASTAYRPRSCGLLLTLTTGPHAGMSFSYGCAVPWLRIIK